VIIWYNDDNPLTSDFSFKDAVRDEPTLSGMQVKLQNNSFIAGLAGICAGFFIIHAAATGLLNLKLTSSRGRANALYVLFYYLGGFTGITLNGSAYSHAGWTGVVALGILMLLAPTFTGLYESRFLRNTAGD
jgi:predicted MFS family arabinose efflux permease